MEDDQRLLAYEYMPTGSLENHLFSSLVAPNSWDKIYNNIFFNRGAIILLQITG